MEKKMASNDLAKQLSRFLSIYLPHERNVSPNTVSAYRDSFISLLLYLRDEKHIKENCYTYEKIRTTYYVNFAKLGIRLEAPYIIKILGKGRKERIVLLQNEQINLLKVYMQENKLLEPHYNQHPLFFNCWGNKLTRSGVNYILKSYADMARKLNPELIPDVISCHVLRHSKAMHLLQAGVNLVYIRDILGHVSVQTTDVYARADSKQKREALEKAYIDVIPESDKEKSWKSNSSLMEWLKSL